MKPWKIVLIPTVIMLVIAAIYIWHVSNKRKNPGVVKQGEEQPKQNVLPWLSLVTGEL